MENDDYNIIYESDFKNHPNRMELLRILRLAEQRGYGMGVKFVTDTCAECHKQAERRGYSNGVEDGYKHAREGNIKEEIKEAEQRGYERATENFVKSLNERVKQEGLIRKEAEQRGIEKGKAMEHENWAKNDSRMSELRLKLLKDVKDKAFQEGISAVEMELKAYPEFFQPHKGSANMVAFKISKAIAAARGKP